MDQRILVITGDAALGALVRSQVENLGCPCNVADSYQDAIAHLAWAELVVADLAEGIDLLHQVRIEAPTVEVLAIVPEDAMVKEARKAGAAHVVTEPFTITDLIDGVRALKGPEPAVIDLTLDAEVEDAPWWASR